MYIDLLPFFYLSGLECGNYELNADNAQGVLLASTFLQCHKSEVVAANYILANIVNSNAFSAFLLGINCGSSYLAESAELYILKNVETYEKKVRSVMDDVLQLEVSGLKILLEEICDNYMAYIVICGWTLYDVGNRSECLASLIADFVNVELISPDAILVDGLEDLSGKLNLFIRVVRMHELTPSPKNKGSLSQCHPKAYGFHLDFILYCFGRNPG